MTRGILGMDIGTTTVKAILFDEQGLAMHVEQEGYPIHYCERNGVEQAPQDWWASLTRLTKRIAARCEADQVEIAAIGVSAQAPVFVPMDLQGEPVGRAMIWMDRRSDEEAQLINETLGRERVETYSRNRADPFYLASKLLWFQRYRREQYDSVSVILQANGYINFKLTGVTSMDVSHASLTQLYDLDMQDWATDALSAFQIDRSILPKVYPCDSIIGSVTAEAAAATGLRQGIPVIAGTVDGVAAALEAGVIEPGIAVEMTGTSSVLLMSHTGTSFAPELTSMTHALPGQTLQLGAMSATGASLKWYADQWGGSDINELESGAASMYAKLNQTAEQASAFHDVIFLPYMMGERSPIWDTDARGVLFGLSLNTEKGHIIRAIMEGAAFALRHNLSYLERSGQKADILRLIGGTARSALWNQIKADVLNREIEVLADSAGAPLGSAILAGMAVGVYPNAAYVVDHVVQTKARIVPSARMHDYYSQKYDIYLELYEQTKAQFTKLSQILSGE